MMSASPDAENYIKMTAEIHYLLGNTLLELDQYNEAMSQYFSAEQIFEITDRLRAVRILITMAEIERAHGNQPHAEALLDRAARLKER